MPVFSTQGGLTFEKVPFAGKGWYANSVGDFNFNDFDFSNSGAYIHLATGDKSYFPGNVSFGYSVIDNSGTLPTVAGAFLYGSNIILGATQRAECFAVSYGGNISAPRAVKGGYIYGNTPPYGNVFNKLFVYDTGAPIAGGNTFLQPATGGATNAYSNISSITSIGNNLCHIMGITSIPAVGSNNYAVFFQTMNITNGNISNNRLLTSYEGSYSGTFDNTIPGDIDVDVNGNIILTYNNQLSSTDLTLNGKVSGMGKLYSNAQNHWGISFYNNNFTTTVNDVITDSNTNIYTVISTDSAYNSYIVKATTTGNIQYNQNLSNVKLTGITVDQYDNIYVAGIDNTNRVYIAELDSSGNLVWQNYLTDNSSTYSVKKIGAYEDYLYVCGNQSTKGFLLKIPINGSIPGNGTYGSITYGVSNATISPSTNLIATYNPGAFFYPAIGGGNPFYSNTGTSGGTVTMTISTTTIT